MAILFMSWGANSISCLKKSADRPLVRRQMDSRSWRECRHSPAAIIRRRPSGEFAQVQSFGRLGQLAPFIRPDANDDAAAPPASLTIQKIYARSQQRQQPPPRRWKGGRNLSLCIQINGFNVQKGGGDIRRLPHRSCLREPPVSANIYHLARGPG